MKVLQLIDSLIPGGAERMAVNYANLLNKNQVESHICVSRKEGLLKDSICADVSYLYLKKKSTFDIKAIMKLCIYVKKNDIDIIHAHSTSYFYGTFLKILYPKIKLVWHDHYGNSEYLDERKATVLKYCSYKFDGIIAVNTALKEWSLKNLNCKKIIKVNNFVNPYSQNDLESEIKGDPSSFKIICVANLRPQKDHETLLKAFELLAVNYNMTLHLIGNDPKTEYSKNILNRIKSSSAKAKIFYYGTKSNVFNYLQKCDIGILSSISEGLPLALLEYGLAGLPVITTSVGQCMEVIKDNGRLVNPKDPNMMVGGILFYYINKSQRMLDAKNFKQYTTNNYSEATILENILKLYSDVLSISRKNGYTD